MQLTVIATVLVMSHAPGQTLWTVKPPPPPPAAAVESDDGVAEEAFRAGSQAYATGKYEEAVRLFERSYELSDKPELLFNLGQAYARWYEVSGSVEHLRRARAVFQQYVKFLERDGDEGARVEARRRLEEIEGAIADHEQAARAKASAKDKPIYKRGWFWGVIGGVVAAAAITTTTVVLVRRRQNSDDPELGTIGLSRGDGPGGLGFRF